MSKQYAKKIRAILNQSAQTVPYIFERFYTVVKQTSLSLSDYDSDPKIFQQFSNIYKVVKRYIKDQPYTLIDSEQKIKKQLKHLVAPFSNFMKEDAISKRILEFFLSQQIGKQLNAFIQSAEKIKKQIQAKNQKIKVFGTNQLASAFWINKFQADYAVHFQTFWIKFLQFVKQFPYFEFFICQSSKKSIRRKVDPQNKYYITSSNVRALFQILSQPIFLQRLADQTAKGQKLAKFISKDFLQIQYTSTSDQQSSIETNLINGETFQISGQDTSISGLAESDQNKKKCKYPPTVLFGSGMDSDVRVKNKYISRKQFMIIQEEEQGIGFNGNISQINMKVNTLSFSLVCLSSSNFTMVSFQRSYMLRVGTIFKIGDISVQILKISNVFVEANAQSSQKIQNSKQDSDNDETLQYLPKKSMVEISDKKQLEYTFLSGPEKGTKGKISSDDSTLKIKENDAKLKLIYNSEEFYLPAETPIYVKTANQVVNGQLSSKIPLEENMKIILEQCQFSIK